MKWYRRAFLWEVMCVTQSVRAHFSLQSCCMPWTSRQSKAATLNWRESDAPLRIITPPPDNERHFKSTRPPPPSRLSYSLIAPVQEEITVLFFSHFLCLYLTHNHKYSIRWPFIFHSTISTSLKMGIIIQACQVCFNPPPKKRQLFTKAAPAAFQLRHFWGPCQLHSRNAGPSISNWLLGRRVLVVCKALCWNRLKSKCQHWCDTGRGWASSLKKLTAALAMTVTQQISFKVKFNKPLKTQDEKKIPHHNIVTIQKSAHKPD